jgi:RHS repeat-associated protein
VDVIILSGDRRHAKKRHVCAARERAGDTYDASFRRYNPTQGRWISPDPAGLSAVNPTNPQSWNRYAYVVNNPLIFIDPLGLGPGDDQISDSGCGGTQWESNAECSGPGGDPDGGGGGGGGGVTVDFPWGWFDWDDSGDWGAGPAGNSQNGGGTVQSWPNGQSLGIPYGVPMGPLTLGQLLGIPGLGGGFGLPCDFGTCGSGAGGEAFADVLTLSGVVFRVTSWASILADVGTAATGGLAGLDLYLLVHDLNQGYRLAQAYGHFLPKAKPVPAHATAQSIVYDWNQFIRDLQACYENFLVGSEAYEECVKQAQEKRARARGKGPLQ